MKKERIAQDWNKALAERQNLQKSLERRQSALEPEKLAAKQAAEAKRFDARVQDRILAVRERGGLQRFESRFEKQNGKTVVRLVDPKNGKEVSFKDLPRSERNKLIYERKSRLKEIVHDELLTRQHAKNLEKQIQAKNTKIQKLENKYTKQIEKRPAPRPVKKK